MPDVSRQPEDVPPDPLVSGLHFRGKLPHLKKEGVIYFVTFRLADSLPASAVARLKHERQAVLEQARAAKSPLTWHEEEQLLAWYCDKVEALLDAGHGACWLSQPDVAELAVGARGRDILLQFLIEAVVLSSTGGLLGIVSGVGGAKLITMIKEWPTLVSANSIIIAFAFSAVVGVFFGFYPARKASQLDPIDALRYE